MQAHAHHRLGAAAAVSLLFCAALLTSCTHAATTTTGGAERRATATLQDPAGDNVGTVTLTQAGEGPVSVAVRLTGVPAGAHGIHFHAVGSCDATGATPFGSAGSHFNPAGKQHGLDNPAGPHAGDLPNVQVAADGTGSASFTTDRISLGAGTTSVFDADGTAVILHAGSDDQRTDPAGNSGARMACGVVTRG